MIRYSVTNNIKKSKTIDENKKNSRRKTSYLLNGWVNLN